MDTNTNTNTNTNTKMPIGYRFCPTDEEIIIHYLRPKVFNFPLPATAIHHHHHLFTHHPAHLPGNPNEKRYFFCKTSDTQQYSLIPSGYWKPIIKNNNNNTHKLILASGCNHPIGFKKSFVFFQFSDHRKSGTRTPWILHQFRLLYPLPIKMEEWMVCSIHMKTKKAKKQHQPPTKKHKRSHTNNTNNINVEIEDDLSSSSSGITFNDDLDDRKEGEEDNDDEIKS